ncbi:MAG: hypothetical protein AAGD14_10200 [Planctomycetota bacterium]
MGKSAATIIGLALLTGAAIFVGRSYLQPASEGAQRQESVLTGHLDPRLVDAFVLQDSELPRGVAAIAVGEPAMYMQVSVLYPALPRVPEPNKHKLTHVNGHPTAETDPVHVTTEVDDDGAFVHCIYRVGEDFATGRIQRGKTVVVPRLVLE